MAHSGKSLGQVQLEVLRYVADHHPITVGDVAEHFAQTAGKARTTVLTVMERLRAKGYVTRRKVKGTYHYSPRVSKGEVLKGVVQRFVSESLGGSLSPFIAYLSETGEVSDEELAKLRQLVRELDQRRKED